MEEITMKGISMEELLRKSGSWAASVDDGVPTIYTLGYLQLDRIFKDSLSHYHKIYIVRPLEL